MSKKAAFLLFFSGFFMASCTCGEMDLGGGDDLDGEETGPADGLDAGDAEEGLWAPPIDNLGEPGWRDSPEPWCAETGTEYELLGYDVWSDASSVTVLGWYFYHVPGESMCPSDDPACWTRSAIFRNDGSGWRMFWEETVAEGTGGVYAISGIPGSYVIALGGHICSFRFVNDGAAACQTLPLVHDVFTVSENLLYVLVDTEGDPNQKVVSFDGATWGPLPVAYTPYQVEHLWADEENVFCVGPDGTILSLEEGDWRIHDPRTLGDFYAVWGFGGADVWAGTDTGELLHYDGETWTAMEWPCMSGYCSIMAMWGSEGVLFFHDIHQLTMWNGTSFEVLLFSDEEAGSRLIIHAIWGNSPSEVFVAALDEAHPNPECGVYYLLWWDGSEFHWF